MEEKEERQNNSPSQPLEVTFAHELNKKDYKPPVIFRGQSYQMVMVAIIRDTVTGIPPTYPTIYSEDPEVTAIVESIEYIHNPYNVSPNSFMKGPGLFHYAYINFVIAASSNAESGPKRLVVLSVDENRIACPPAINIVVV